MSTPNRIETPIESAARELAHDHARLDEILDDVRSMLADGELERAEYVFRDLHEGLLRHIRVEDTLLFPLLEKHPMLQPAAQVMRQEHRRIEGILAALEDALAEERAAEAKASLDRLADVLASHNHKEERVLYPRVDRLLDAGQRAALADELGRR
jgi:regulator of cell morphogenesis and NO signaling